MSQVDFDGGDLVACNFVVIGTANELGEVTVYQNDIPSHSGQIQSFDGLEYQTDQGDNGDFEFSYDSIDTFFRKTEHVVGNLDNFELALQTPPILTEGDIKNNNDVEEINRNINEQDHLVQRSDDNLFTCMVCNVESTVRGEAKAIITHMRQIHNKRLYICDVCGQDFRKRSKLTAHIDAHLKAEEGDFQCEVCNRIFSNLKLFRIHKRMHIPQNKAWSCDLCAKKYNSKNLLDEHYNTHTGLRPYQCSICGKDFTSKYTFKAHKKTHLDRPRKFKCPQCKSSFMNQQNLNQHQRIHNDVKDFQCQLCSKQFSSAYGLEAHSITHTGKKPFECTVCTRKFARKAEITDHMRTHTGERPYKCDICDKAFSQRSNLQSHKKATHFNYRGHKCAYCEKSFKRKRLADYHIMSVHTFERPYKCEECDSTFVYPEHFKKHKRIHTGDRPYACVVCHKTFSSRDNRNSHYYTHSEKKQFECTVCHCGFMRKPYLLNHMTDARHMSNFIQVNQPLILREDNQYVTITTNGEVQGIKGDMALSTLQAMPAAEGENANFLIQEDVLLEVNQNFITDGKQSGIFIYEGQEYQYYTEEVNGGEGEGVVV